MCYFFLTSEVVTASQVIVYSSVAVAGISSLMTVSSPTSVFVIANNIQDLILLASLNVFVPGLLAEYFEGFELLVFNFDLPIIPSLHIAPDNKK